LAAGEFSGDWVSLRLRYAGMEMYKFIVAVLFFSVFPSALAARQVNLESLEQIVNVGEIYNINILFSSKSNSKGENYVVAHYGGYYSGSCKGQGPCGCGNTGYVSIIKFSENEKPNLIETKTVEDSCSNSEENQYSVKYSKEYVFLFSEKGESPAYFINKSNLELSFITTGNNFTYASDSPLELNDSYVGDAPYTENNPGFSCKEASNYVEKQICNSVELTELDAKMSTLYRNLLNKASDTDASNLKKSQIEFNKTRAKLCTDVACIKEMTSNRITKLSR
jgi:uncharacterized protein YecT (DUF1311 family)